MASRLIFLPGDITVPMFFVVVNGEGYFRGLWEEGGGGTATWNLRDQHMVHTMIGTSPRPVGAAPHAHTV